MRLPLRFACFLALCLSWPAALLAQDYPTKVVRLIVPYPPGGVVDITGRLLADQLGRELGGTVIVENKAGAGGTIGADQAARVPAGRLHRSAERRGHACHGTVAVQAAAL